MNENKYYYDDSIEEDQNSHSYTEEELKKLQTKAFAMNLTRIRRDRGLMQSELADRLGITQSRITEYETGKKMPRLKRIREFATILRCEIDDLLDMSSLFRSAEDLSYNDYLEILGDRYPNMRFFAVSDVRYAERWQSFGMIMESMEKMSDYELSQFYQCSLMLLDQAKRRPLDPMRGEPQRKYK